MSKLYLQNIIDEMAFKNLPAKWQGFDLPANRAQAGFMHISKNKKPFNFQIN
jgi:hypothetical protein